MRYLNKSLSLLIAISCLLLMSCSEDPNTNKTSTSAESSESQSPVSTMPEFSDDFSKMASGFYRLRWTSDGYPGQLQDDGSIWKHPIYPTYVLDDYLYQYEKNPSLELRKAISSVAHIAITHMENYEGALVFWYEPGRGARLFKRHYSALTQGYYAEQLWRAGDLLNDESLLVAARSSFLALTIPHEKGGVLFVDANGTSIAEVPQEPNSYILNGWQSALVSAWNYYELSGDPIAHDLVIESSKTMKKLLPLYDAPDQKNSRYGLTGFTYLRTSNSDIKDLTISIPGEGEFALTSYDSRWANHRVNERQVNLVVSKGSYPEPNAVTIEVDAPTSVELFVGDYDPLSSSPVNNKWVKIGMVDSQSSTLVIPWDLVNKIVYPTNFVKVIDGINTNVYHPIHINRLSQLQNITGDAELGVWADKWKSYMCSWNEIYPGLSSRSFSRGSSNNALQNCN